jgi:hypothetical protein
MDRSGSTNKALDEKCIAWIGSDKIGLIDRVSDEDRTLHVFDRLLNEICIGCSPEGHLFDPARIARSRARVSITCRSLSGGRSSVQLLDLSIFDVA